VEEKGRPAHVAEKRKKKRLAGVPEKQLKGGKGSEWAVVHGGRRGRGGKKKNIGRCSRWRREKAGGKGKREKKNGLLPYRGGERKRGEKKRAGPNVYHARGKETNPDGRKEREMALVPFGPERKKEKKKEGG